MAKTDITNLSREPLDFIVGVKDGDPITDCVRPGETKAIEVDLASAQVLGRLQAGLISMPKAAIKQVAKAADPA